MTLIWCFPRTREEVLIFLRLWSRRRAIWFRLLSFLYKSSPACLPDSTIEVDLVLDLLSGLRFSSSSGTCFSRLMTLFLLKEKFFPTDFPLAWTRSLSSLLLLLGPASPPYSMSQVWKKSYRFCFGIAKRKKSPTLEKGEGVQTTQYHHSYIFESSKEVRKC